MSNKAIYGLKSIALGAVINNTTMPEVGTMTAFETYRDTFEMAEEEGEITEEYADQYDEAFINFQAKGKKDIKVSTFDYTPEFLKSVKGGTVLDGEWTEGDGVPQIFNSLLIITDSGHTIKCPKVQVFARLNLKLVKKGVALLELTFKPLSKIGIKAKK